MALEQMTADQINDTLFLEIGETGNAELRQGDGLYIQKEENGSWWFVGTVADSEEAQAIIDAFFR